MVNLECKQLMKEDVIMVVANVNSQNNTNPNNTIEFVAPKNSSDNKQQSSIIEFTFPDDKADIHKDDSIKEIAPKTNNVRIETGVNITRHLQVYFDTNSQYPTNIFVSGNDYIGKIQARYFNHHPQVLVDYLNKNNLFDNKISLKQIKTI